MIDQTIIAQRAHDVNAVFMSHRRLSDVITTSCALWEKLGKLVNYCRNDSISERKKKDILVNLHLICTKTYSQEENYI